MAGTGLDRLSVLPSGLANQRHNRSRIGIAMSGGPNPAESIDLVVLAERLGSASTGVAEGLAATSAPCLVACAIIWRSSSPTASAEIAVVKRRACPSQRCTRLSGILAWTAATPKPWRHPLVVA